MSIAWLAPGPAWDALVRECPGTPASFTSGWARTLAAAGSQAIAARFRLAAAKEALLPLIVNGQRAISPSPYGGLASPVPLDDDETQWAIRMLSGHFGRLQLLNNPFAPAPNLPRPSRHALFQSLPPTHVLALGRLQALRLGYAPSRQISSALWHILGIRIDFYPPDPATWLDLYHFSRLQWLPAPPQKRERLAQLWQELSGVLHLAVARQQGEWVGFATFTLHGGVAQWLDGMARAANPEIVTALWEACLSRAHESGARWWDFGPRADQATAARSFGATPWPRTALTDTGCHLGLA